ncbi:hypothetical protein GGF31_000356 [Allomyces arbusculus]|nr:hypothetical protein GGF31_000356 [Allomyces arbusculus]
MVANVTLSMQSPTTATMAAHGPCLAARVVAVIQAAEAAAPCSEAPVLARVCEVAPANHPATSVIVSHGSRLLERAVMARNAATSTTHLTCWPASPRAPAMHVSWRVQRETDAASAAKCPVMGAVAASSSSNGRAPSPSPSKVGRHGSKRRGGRKTPPKAVEAPLGHPRVSSMTTTVHVDAELLPYFLDEDDACDWHMAVRDACPAARTDYAAAKREADDAFVAASNTEFAHRGIGGLRVAVPTMDSEDPDILLQRIVLPLMETYLTLLTRHADEMAAAEEEIRLGLPDPEDQDDVEALKSVRTTLKETVRDLPPAGPAHPLTAAELAWVALRKGHLALALHESGVPLPCLPPHADFAPRLLVDTVNNGTTPEDETLAATIPRRARSLAVVLRSPRPSYIETLFVQALRGVSVARPPVWLHRQAGRYLPEYMAAKGTKNFLDMTADPVLAAEITLQPVWRYNVDCAIIFSDIMTIPQALGMELIMQPGPFFPNPIRTLEDIERLAYQPAILEHVYAALRQTRAQLAHDKALVGFCGGPWTLMAYMIGKDLAKKWLHMHPDWAHQLLRKCTDVAIDYLAKQVDAGADVVQVFESNAADLGPADFYEFALPYLTDIAQGVKGRHPHVPMTLFPRGANYATARIAQETLYDAISVDWAGVPAEARAAAGEFVTLQGNLEPDALYEPHDKIRAKVREMIAAFGRHRYIVNLGHGTKPDMDPEAIGAFVDEAQTVVIGSRNSPLAMAQAHMVQAALERAGVEQAERHATALAQSSNPGWSPAPKHRFRIDGVATKGDKILDVALAKIGSRGLFTKELEWSLMRGRVHLVQHSLKDLETRQPAGLALAAVLKRADRRDALVSRAEHKYTLATLPKGATVGTSSLRRRAQLAAVRPDLKIIDVRGNLNTRIAKLLGTHAPTANVRYDALVLAMAGLERVPESGALLAACHVQALSPTPGAKAEPIFVPSTSQGAIGVQVRARDRGVRRLLRVGVDHTATRAAIAHERAMLAAVEGGCQVPVAVLATALDVQGKPLPSEFESGKKLEWTAADIAGWRIEGHVWSLDGTRHVSATTGSGIATAKELLRLGGDRIIEDLRREL